MLGIQKKLLPPLPPKEILSVSCPKAKDDCPECDGGGVVPTSQGNRPCSRCETTEQDLVWKMIPNPERNK
jgi:hypothetical protein